jgi:hypothetical protein
MRSTHLSKIQISDLKPSVFLEEIFEQEQSAVYGGCMPWTCPELLPAPIPPIDHFPFPHNGEPSPVTWPRPIIEPGLIIFGTK